jgi:hypothetical protein
MRRRDLFTLAGGGVAAFLVAKYGPPRQHVVVDWGTFNPYVSPQHVRLDLWLTQEQIDALRKGLALAS